MMLNQGLVTLVILINRGVQSPSVKSSELKKQLEHMWPFLSEAGKHHEPLSAASYTYLSLVSPPFFLPIHLPICLAIYRYLFF